MNTDKKQVEEFAKELTKLDKKESEKLYYIMQGMKLAKEI